MTGYLLDTDALLIMGFEQSARSRKAADALMSEPRFASPISAFEMAVKRAIGNLALPASFQLSFRHGFEETLDELAADLLDLGLRHIDMLSRLPLIHRDPFDRLLIAQALTEDLTIVSSDRTFHLYPGLEVLEI